MSKVKILSMSLEINILLMQSLLMLKFIFLFESSMPTPYLISNELNDSSPSFDPKTGPFYVSLFINGHKLSNCIIDFGTLDNIMPSTVAKDFSLSFTKIFGRFYSMDSKQIPLHGQIKDVQVALATHPSKRVKLTILVANIPANYGMLLSRTFCKDLGGEIKMDWSRANILVGKQKVVLQPETKAQFTVFPSDDPKSHILYLEYDFSNYMIFSDSQNENSMLEPKCSDNIWIMEFDGSCSTIVLGVGVVLISPNDEKFPFAFKLEFKNTNNTVEYEALLLGLEEAKKKGIKMLQAKGDAELIIKHVRSIFTMKNERLKHYRKRVWDQIESFVAFSIEAIPKDHNTWVDSHTVSASLMLPRPNFKEEIYRIKLFYRPNMPDDSKSWQVFESDKQIDNFLQSAGMFMTTFFEGSGS